MPIMWRTRCLLAYTMPYSLDCWHDFGVTYPDNTYWSYNKARLSFYCKAMYAHRLVTVD